MLDTYNNITQNKITTTTLEFYYSIIKKNLKTILEISLLYSKVQTMVFFHSFFVEKMLVIII